MKEQLFISSAILLISWILMWIWRVCYKRLMKKNGPWRSAVAASLRFPLQFLLFCSGLLGVAFYWEGNRELLWGIYYTIPIITTVWILINFAKRGEQAILQKRHGHIDELSVNLAIRILYIGIILGGLLLILPLLKISITGLLAFGGMGAIVAGIAAKDMLANIFGGFILILDKPFKAGDWIVAHEKEIEGCVEHVGWRTTRLCSIDQHMVYVPNSLFSTTALENLSRSLHRALKETIILRHQDDKQLLSIIKDIRNYLLAHDRIDKNQSCLVYMESPSRFGLPVTIRAYMQQATYTELLVQKGEIYLQIAQIVHKHGAEFTLSTT